MATQIPERIATLPEPPYKGIDLGAVFIAKAEGFRYALKYSFSPTVNTIIDGMNNISNEVSQSSLLVETNKNLTLGYSNSASQKASEANTSANQALTYKNQIQGYVIPVGTSYSIEEINTQNSAMTKAQFNALSEERKANRAGSGLDYMGKGSSTTSLNVNEGIWTDASQTNRFYIGKTTANAGTSITNEAQSMVNGILQKLKNVNNATLAIAEILCPTAPNIYPYNTVLTTEQINSGVIKHADSSNSGLVTMGKNLSGTTFNQTVTVVNGKKYIIEYVDNGVRKTLEITASSTSYIISLSGTNITEVGMYPLDAISRSDLVFLESWHEDVSEKNIVYPLGNIQYLGGNTDGLTGIANGSFTGFETYSLFGNWQTPSALIGKGYVWSSLTEAQKKAFIANPDNNCYLDGDKVIQVRYRVRVLIGEDTNSMAKATVQGKSVVPSTVLFTAPTTTVDAGLYSNTSATYTYTGTTTGAISITTVSRRNQGMYHPVYNANGTKKASDGNFWYNTAVSFTSISDCFDAAKLLTASGYIGTVSGRPDGLFYDQVHESDILDLRNSSKKVEDYSRLREREFNKLVNGATRGKEGEVQIFSNFNRVLSFGNFNGGINTRPYLIGNSDLPNIPIALATNITAQYPIVIVIKSGLDTGKVLVSRAYFKNDGTYFALGESSTTFNLVRYTDGSIPSVLTGQTVDIHIACPTTRTKSNTLLHCDIIGNPTNYPTAWKQSGVFGTPLIVAEDGTSLLPNGVLDTFKLSRKANATPLFCLRSTDNGTTWASFTPTFSTTTNAITLTDEPATNLVMVYYQTHTSMAVPVVNSEVLEYGKVIGTNGLANAHLISTLIGKVSTANTAPYLQMGYDVNAYRIDTSTLKFSTTSTEIPVHSALSLGGGASGVATVKVLPYLTRLNGKAYLNLVFKEMKHNGTSWGDSNTFNIVDNVSTTVDNNAQTVLIGQKTVELNVFIGADE